MQVSQKLPEGDHENEYTLHDSIISDSSSVTLCVNNEHSIANPTFADEENAEFDGLFKPKIDLSGASAVAAVAAGFRDSH